MFQYATHFAKVQPARREQGTAGTMAYKDCLNNELPALYTNGATKVFIHPKSSPISDTGNQCNVDGEWERPLAIPLFCQLRFRHLFAFTIWCPNGRPIGHQNGHPLAHQWEQYITIDKLQIILSRSLFFSAGYASILSCS